MGAVGVYPNPILILIAAVVVVVVVMREVTTMVTIEILIVATS